MRKTFDPLMIEAVICLYQNNFSYEKIVDLFCNKCTTISKPTVQRIVHTYTNHNLQPKINKQIKSAPPVLKEESSIELEEDQELIVNSCNDDSLSDHKDTNELEEFNVIEEKNSNVSDIKFNSKEKNMAKENFFIIDDDRYYPKEAVYDDKSVLNIEKALNKYYERLGINCDEEIKNKAKLLIFNLAKDKNMCIDEIEDIIYKMMENRISLSFTPLIVNLILRIIAKLKNPYRILDKKYKGSCKLEFDYSDYEFYKIFIWVHN